MTDQKRPKKATIDEALSCPEFIQASKRAASRLERTQRSNTDLDPENKFGAFIRDPRKSCDFRLETSDSWNSTKLCTYVNTLCQCYGIENWNTKPTTGEKRAIKENRDLIDHLMKVLEYDSRKDLLTFFRWWFEHWDLFVNTFAKASEMGYHPPFWLKADARIKKFRDLYYNNAEKPLDSKQPPASGDDFVLE